MPEYIVVSRAQSGVRFGKDDPLTVRQFPTSVGPVDILFRSRLVSLSGFTKPVQMGLMAEVRGSAPSLDEALQEFSRAAQSLCPVFVLIGNTPIEDLTPELGYDVSPEVTERDYFQQHLPEERLLMIQRRRISAEQAVRVLAAVARHADAERIRRALAQYYQALRYWQPGQEVLALAHLWMGVEALTPVPLSRTLKERGMSRSGLAAYWGVEENRLEAEVRKRLIMHGDADAYKKAKLASDGFEHGFLGLPEVHAHSDQVRVEVAEHLRRSILDELKLDPPDLDTLTKPPYDRAGHLHSAKYIRGKLVAQTSNLAAPDQAYPMLRWKTSYRDISDASSNEVSMDIDETFTGVFAEGVSFRLSSIEVWGGQELALKKKATSSVNPSVTSSAKAAPAEQVNSTRYRKILFACAALVLSGLLFWLL